MTSLAQECSPDKRTIPADYTRKLTIAAVRLLIAQERTDSCHAWVIVKFLFIDLIDGTIENKHGFEVCKRDDISNPFAEGSGMRCTLPMSRFTNLWKPSMFGGTLTTGSVSGFGESRERVKRTRQVGGQACK